MLSRFVLAAAAVSGVQAQNAAAPVTVVGEFSNLRFTEEHAYGYTVQLWRDGAAAFGLFLASEGLAGDTPTGSLENVKFDSRSGRLSFQARLTLGVQLDAKGNQQPSRDLFEFDGTLKRGELTGAVKHTDQAHANLKATVERVSLKRRADGSMSAPRSYAEWKTSVAEILKRRGPRW